MNLPLGARASRPPQSAQDGRASGTHSSVNSYRLIKMTTPRPPASNTQPLPHWHVDFPVNWQGDHQVSRRQFTTLLTLLSGALFLGTGLVGLREWWRRQFSSQPPEVRIAQRTEIPVGGVKLFHYPTTDDPCLLIHVSADHFIAYSQQCTHLSCPVIYQATDQRLHCPCHKGAFAVEDGRVLAGPPQRSLPRITLRFAQGEIWATGVEL